MADRGKLYEGEAIDVYYDAPAALCRCARSENQPFCDNACKS